MEILILLFYYFLILLSIIGFGYLTPLIFRKSYQISDLGLRGLLILILVSYTTNFFISHSYTHNLILLLIGLTSFLFLLLKKKIR